MNRSRLPLLPVLAVAGLSWWAAPSQARPAGTPTFRQYHAPNAPLDAQGARTKGDAAGEPSLGLDTRTGDVMYMANKATFRVHGFDLSRNEAATWTDVTDPVEGAQTSDPILYTDPVTNRTVVNQLELQGGSLQAYTDDQGRTWTHSTNGASVGLSFDHQTIVSGRPSVDGTTYPKPVIGSRYYYYCTNDLYAANCSVSVDGGLNFLAAVPVYPGVLAGGPCAAIFGHIKTDPTTGYVYLPPDGCNGSQMLYVSRDNTLSWTGYHVPGSTQGDSGHPSVAVGRHDGAVYYAWGSGDGSHSAAGVTGRIHVALSRDHGQHWQHSQALGADLGVVTARFPVAVAGDDGRAAVAFLGAKVPGDPNLAPDATTPGVKAYAGVWDLYVSYTADFGATWKTYDAFPRDPIQRGPVCTRGTTCLAGRNLLDFNDMVIDPTGHVAIALADGALTPTDTYAQGLAKATVVRQVGGPSLYAASVTAPATVRGSAAVVSSRAFSAGADPGRVVAGVSVGHALPVTGLPVTVPLIGASAAAFAFALRRLRRRASI